MLNIIKKISIKSGHFALAGLLVFYSTVLASLPGASDQFLQSLDRSASGLPEPGEGHTLDFVNFKKNPLVNEVEKKIIKGEAVTPELREKTQMMLDKVEDLDKRCAATPEGPTQDACVQQRDAAIAQIEKIAADNNPDIRLLISQSAQEAGDFSEFDPSNLVQQFDGNFAQTGNLMDMAGSLSNMPQTPTKEALQIPLPLGPSNDITQQLDLGDNLEHKRLAQAETQPVSGEQLEGFFDQIQNYWREELQPGLQQALFIQVWAQSAFSPRGQSGNSALRVITNSRDTDSFAAQSKAINDERDRRITKENDIAGQGMAAIQERATQNMEVMNEITQQQEEALQAIQHQCQKQRADIPCWETGNEIPFDIMALLMGIGGGGGSTPPEAPALEPYTVWLHCPLPNQPFTITSEGNTHTALLLEEKSRLMLTVDSVLPNPLHPDGCIVGLLSDEGLQYFTAEVQPDVSTNENRVTADLVLLEIQQVHQELGEDLADPDTPFDDFVNEYWPQYLSASCQNDGVFRMGDELQLIGYEPLESESEGPEEVVVLNGLANFVAEENGATRFSTNGEESFSGGLVARTETGCFKGLGKIEIDLEEESNTQTLIPVELVKQWLASQEITLPEPQNETSDR